jgi:DinB superfamily
MSTGAPGSADRGRPVVAAFDEVWDRFRTRIADIDDDEYLWEPVAGCWSVRPGPGGRWSADGDDPSTPVPDPPPLTTIAWRLRHIGLSFVGFGDRFFGDGTLVPESLPAAATAAEALAFLDDAYETHWRRPLDVMPAERWTRPIGSRFGPYADVSGTGLALHVLDELTHHAAEVGVLRDLYLRRSELGGS